VARNSRYGAEKKSKRENARTNRRLGLVDRPIPARRIYMKPMVLVGILLILLGIVALSYNQITYTTEEKIAEIGPLKATAEKEKSIPLPPLLGSAAVLAGIGLIAVGYKQ
jgi:hypothetical protein